MSRRERRARARRASRSQLNGTPSAADPFAQAVAAGWIGPGTGPTSTITQLEFDHGVVRILGLAHAAKALNHLHTADRVAPTARPSASGSSRMVRAVGARTNVPDGSDQWELWPNDPLRRANLAAEAYQVVHLSLVGRRRRPGRRSPS